MTATSRSHSSPAVTVVTCTYNRPDLLVRAVRGCLKNATRRGLSFEIVVADNSKDGYATQTLTAALGTEPLGDDGPVRVVRAVPSNISIARNAGIMAAQADLIAFLDDDSLPDPGWLDALTDTLEATDADVVTGPVIPICLNADGEEYDGIPSADAKAMFWFCSRDMDAPTGTPIFVDGPKKTRSIAMGTDNTLWRVATTFRGEPLFDPAFGRSGGEDVDLFMRLERRGCRFAWCADTAIRSVVALQRQGLRYMALRGLASGWTYTAAAVKNDPRPRRRLARIIGRSLLQIGVYGALVPVTPFLSTLRRRRILIGLFMGLGKLMWWRTLHLYN